MVGNKGTFASRLSVAHLNGRSVGKATTVASSAASEVTATTSTSVVEVLAAAATAAILSCLWPLVATTSSSFHLC